MMTSRAPKLKIKKVTTNSKKTLTEQIAELPNTTAVRTKSANAGPKLNASEKTVTMAHSLKQSVALLDDLSALDTSSDFTGGCSQYKYAAVRALAVQQIRVKRKKKDGKSSASAGASKDPIINTELTEPRGNDEKVRNNAVEMETAVTDNQTKECSTCLTLVPVVDFSSHTLLCLRSKYERKPSNTKRMYVNYYLQVFYC